LIKFKIIIIILLIPLLLYLTGCNWAVLDWQKTKGRDLNGGSESNNQETANSISLETISSSTESSTSLPISSDAEKETEDIIKTDADNESSSTEKGNIESNADPQKYAVIVAGISLDSQHYKWFLNSTNMAYKLLKNNGYTDENIYYLFESSKEPHVDYEATIDNFKKVAGELKGKAKNMDNIILFLIGHGSYRSTNSYYSLTDYSLPDFEMAEMFKGVKRNKLIFVFSPCNSGGFVDDLSGENTVVITSARKDESNRAAFIEPFLTSFNGTGDADKDGLVSFKEAFNYACINVQEQFAGNNWGTLTEHAQLDDNGDKISHEYPIPAGGDGLLAENIYLR
jgi:hypothetical protein